MNQNPDEDVTFHEPVDLEDLVPLGLLLDEERGSLPYTLIHGEALVACAAWALGEAGVQPVDGGTSWEEIALAGEPVVLHDPLCPMTPADFIAACVLRAATEDVVVVAVRPVTDTVKTVADGVVGETVDRDDLRALASPVVLPASVVAALPGLPSIHFDEFPTDTPKREIEISEAAQRLANALHLHLD